MPTRSSVTTGIREKKPLENPMSAQMTARPAYVCIDGRIKMLRTRVKLARRKTFQTLMQGRSATTPRITFPKMWTIAMIDVRGKASFCSDKLYKLTISGRWMKGMTKLLYANKAQRRKATNYSISKE